MDEETGKTKTVGKKYCFCCKNFTGKVVEGPLVSLLTKFLIGHGVSTKTQLVRRGETSTAASVTSQLRLKHACLL